MKLYDGFYRDQRSILAQLCHYESKCIDPCAESEALSNKSSDPASRMTVSNLLWLWTSIEGY